MRYLGYQRLGTMPILAMNGEYQFGPANQTHPELGHYNSKARVPNICSNPATQCTRGLPPVVRNTIVADNTYQEKIVEKRNHLPMREDKSASTHTTTCGDN